MLLRVCINPLQFFYLTFIGLGSPFLKFSALDTLILASSGLTFRYLDPQCLARLFCSCLIYTVDSSLLWKLKYNKYRNTIVFQLF